MLAALAVRLALSRLPCPWAWQFAVGLTWCFHCVFTLRSLQLEQPDIQEYGHVFSYVLIWIFNVAGAAFWIVVTADIPLDVFARAFADRTQEAYVAVWQGCRWLYGSVRSLPVLQK